uniref:SCAN box domain-containing protein n=1 Tax=Leptobrachium leishanense TaxID=445787 RepID=A0A8C5WKP4_9ANUR
MSVTQPLPNPFNNIGIQAQRLQFIDKPCMRNNDVESYLLAFERTATREAWPPEQWAGIIAPFLLGEAQKAYFDLEEEAAADYPQLKAEIMARMGVTTTVRAQRFYKWRFNERQAPRSQMIDLIHLARKWLRPESQSPAQMVESLVLDRYLRELPSGLREQCRESRRRFNKAING